MCKRKGLTQEEQDYLERRKQQGGSHQEVAQELGCSVETVRKKWKAFRHNLVAQPRGRPAKGVLSQYEGKLVEAAVRIKRAHAHWGPANVKIELIHELGYAKEELPSGSRLAVLFKERCPEAVQPRQKRVSFTPLPDNLKVHQRWQMDAVEKICFGDGQFATLLEIREPVGALIIASRAFETTHIPSHTWRKLTLEEVRETLRSAFQLWGSPEAVQTDHEGVFVGAVQNDFPTVFTLWLKGLAIQHVVSHAGCPTDQAQVERNHRTIAEMCWKDQTFRTLADLQQQVDQACQRYNQELPVHAGQCHGKAPLQAEPQALHSGRAYDPTLEYELFDLLAIDHFLASRVWTRKTDINGVLWLGSWKYYLTRAMKGQVVSIRFLPESRSFVFESRSDGTQRDLPAHGLNKNDLTGLSPLPILANRVFQYPLPLVGGMIFQEN